MDQKSRLIEAIRRGDKEDVVKNLEVINFGEGDNPKGNPLYLAFMKKNYDIVLELLYGGGDPLYVVGGYSIFDHILMFMLKRSSCVKLIDYYIFLIILSRSYYGLNETTQLKFEYFRKQGKFLSFFDSYDNSVHNIFLIVLLKNILECESGLSNTLSHKAFATIDEISLVLNNDVLTNPSEENIIFLITKFIKYIKIFNYSDKKNKRSDKEHDIIHSIYNQLKQKRDDRFLFRILSLITRMKPKMLFAKDELNKTAYWVPFLKLPLVWSDDLKEFIATLINYDYNLLFSYITAICRGASIKGDDLFLLYKMLLIYQEENIPMIDLKKLLEYHNFGRLNQILLVLVYYGVDFSSTYPFSFPGTHSQLLQSGHIPLHQLCCFKDDEYHDLENLFTTNTFTQNTILHIIQLGHLSLLKYYVEHEENENNEGGDEEDMGYKKILFSEEHNYLMAAYERGKYLIVLYLLGINILDYMKDDFIANFLQKIQHDMSTNPNDAFKQGIYTYYCILHTDTFATLSLDLRKFLFKLYLHSTGV